MSIYIIRLFSSRRRHTRFDCDWSSDVCSSDLSKKWHPPRRSIVEDLERSRPSDPGGFPLYYLYHCNLYTFHHRISNYPLCYIFITVWNLPRRTLDGAMLDREHKMLHFVGVRE